MCPSQQTWSFDLPDSRVRPLTTSLHGPAPMALKAWICSSYSVHSSRSSTVYSLSNRSLITFVRVGDCRSTRQNFILYPTDSGLPLYCVSGSGWQTTKKSAMFLYRTHCQGSPNYIPRQSGLLYCHRKAKKIKRFHDL